MSTKTRLVALVGAGCCALLLKYIPEFEGRPDAGYLDVVGIPTKCYGDTQNVVVGKRYTDEECKASLEDALLRHAEPVLKCTPVLKDRTYQLAAAISFAYNIGTNAYCNSMTAQRFNAGNFKGACKAINEADNGAPQWVYSKGKKYPGLVKRRAVERALCEKDL